MKIVRETRKIMGDPNLRVNATAARVPVWFGQQRGCCTSRTRDRITARERSQLLADAPGVPGRR